MTRPRHCCDTGMSLAGVEPEVYAWPSCRFSRCPQSVPMLTHKQQAAAGLIWCPLCYEGLRHRKFRRGHLGDNHKPRKERSCMSLKKPSGNGSSGQSSLAATLPGSVLAAFPTLLEFLTLPSWDDGSPRQLGTIILFVEGHVWKACLKDKNGPTVSFVTARTLDDLLLSVEEGLASEGLDWRPDRPSGGRR
jgi:hypothetical protein